MGNPHDSGEQVSPKMRRDLKRLHRQMAADEAAGGVVPPTPIENLRTGQLTHFGPRRAYDGAYVGELLSAKGIRQSDVEGLRFIAKALGPEFAHMKIGELDKLSILFHEQITEEEMKALRKPHLHVVE
jgi:hypothetical protein